LGERKTGRYRILDTCNSVLDTAGKSTSVKLEDLRASMAKDGVHFTQTGYKNVVTNVLAALEKLQSGQTENTQPGGNTAASSVSGCRHHWRGITSPNGSKAHQQAHSWAKWAKNKPHMNYGPYSQKGWRSGKKY
jgi:hypothetical protein